MIAFKGDYHFANIYQLKRMKYGIRVWMAPNSSNGYVVNFSVYLGSEGIRRCHRLGYVIMDMVHPFFKRNHHVFFRNFLPSPILLD